MKKIYVTPQTEEMVLKTMGIIMTSFDPNDPNNHAPARRGDLIG